MIQEKGWVHTNQTKNDGAVGNTLEDLLEIPENNLAIANTVDWELKAQRKHTTSMITLCHLTPHSRKPRGFFRKILLPNYGWAHDEAGKKYGIDEMSFRATISGLNYTERGIKAIVNSINRTIDIVLNPLRVEAKHEEWLKRASNFHGMEEKVVAFYNFDDVKKKSSLKLEILSM